MIEPLFCNYVCVSGKFGKGNPHRNVYSNLSKVLDTCLFYSFVTTMALKKH